MTVFPRVAIWDGVRVTVRVQSLSRSRGYSTVDPAQQPDVLVVEPGSDIGESTIDSVRSGVGLVVLVDPQTDLGASGSAVRSLLTAAGIEINEDPAGGCADPARDETGAVTDLDLLARVRRQPVGRHRDVARGRPCRCITAPRRFAGHRRRRRVRVRCRTDCGSRHPADRADVGRRAPVQCDHLRRRPPAAPSGQDHLADHHRSWVAATEVRGHRPAGTYRRRTVPSRLMPTT